jgi:hypothetical protein
MNNKTKYRKETQTALLQGKQITVTHLTPILSPTQRENQKREVENQLYEVFSKYKSIRKKHNDR